MKKYIFPDNFGTLEIENPLVISVFVNGLYPEEMTIDATVVLSVDGVNIKYGVQLTGIKVQNLNYNPSELVSRVVEHLDINFLV